MPFPISALRVARLRLQPIGEGTERVEEEARRRFPSARVLRVDGETMRRPKQAAAIWSRIQRREWDVLVGTQLVLRHDVVPPVGLVGVVQADAGLSLPDFRAAERTYHLLHDAIGFAQPLSIGGRIILQTYLPSHHTIQAVGQQDRGTLPNGRNGTPNRARISSGRSPDRAACLRSAGRGRRTSRSSVGRSIGSYGQKSCVQRGNSR